MRSRLAALGLMTAMFLLSNIFVGPNFSASADRKATKSKSQKVQKERGEKSRGGGADPNIKSDQESADPDKPAPLPPNKGGEKPKGGGPSACTVVFENYTGWDIHIYIDGEYRGVLGAGDDVHAYTGNGRTTLYGVRTFSDGSKISWGPRVIDCQGRYNWQLIY